MPPFPSVSRPMADVTVHFEDHPDRPTLAVSGAWGGSSPDGAQVVAHVYSEWGMLPSILQIPVDDEGVGHVKDQTAIRRGDVLREIQGTLVMSPEAAINIGQWLMGKGIAAYKKRGERPPPFEEEGLIPGDEEQ